MPYPSLDQYQSAVQNPNVAFRDPALQRGEVGKDPLGIPEPYGGGFAYTYSFKSNGSNFAVRCFKGENQRRQQRYNAISTWMRSTPRPYWVSFDYQPTGISVCGNTYPIVKMDWAKGLSLGAYVYKHHSDAPKMRALRDQFVKLASDFERMGCAHGDLQNGNVLVGSDGSLILIDYDGLYVPGMQQGDGDEIGIAHFQHPSRTEKLFGPRMDRFAFAVIWLSLESLSRKPDLYDKYGTSDNIIFSATDYVQWSSAEVVRELLAVKELSPHVARLGRLCEIAPDDLPPLCDFIDVAKPIAGKVVIAPAVAPALVPVLDALAYDDIRRHVGERIEVRGEITEVHYGRSRNTQREYVLISFTNYWQGPQFRIAIWNLVLPQMQRRPDDSWVGRYVSVSGLVDPEYQYTNRGRSYPRLGITIQEENQLRFINRPKPKPVVQPRAVTRNADILKTIKTPTAPANQSKTPVPQQVQQTTGQQVATPTTPSPPDSNHAGAGAVTAGLIGLAVGGPVGLIVGGIAGFFVGKKIKK
ncbi:MAG: hypothetical protein BWX54_01323 [Verrucomicrobia bacterium ADurb.Bin018]|nr:MAG: hypothetical protein BWX54_01323 [Verrucomicrobia bacterium ADurb.Bin018]